MFSLSGKGVLIGGVAIIAVLYLTLFAVSARGYGYPGHNGYHHHGASMWYWGGPARYYPGQSVRNGSLGGPGRTGGISGGK